MKRVLTTLALIPFAVYTIFFSPQWFFDAVAIAMALLCYFEVSNILAAHGVEPPGWPGCITGLLLFLGIGWVRVVALVAMTLSLRFRDMAKALPYAAGFVFAAVYVFGAWRCAIDLRALNV